MGRLIDHTRLRTEVDLLLKKKLISPPTMAMIHNLIDAQPTAFDVEAVVKELEEKIAEAGRIMLPEVHDELDRIANDIAEDFIMAYEEAIEIVRKGGVK